MESESGSTLVHKELLHEIFEATVDVVPNKTALIYENLQVSYQALEARANQLAQYLRNEGIGRGMFVGIYLPRGIDVTVAILAILKTGAAYLPLDPQFPIERVIYGLQDARASALITHTDLMLSEAVLPCPAFIINRLQNKINQQSKVRLTRRDTGLNSDDSAYAICTSGSTGRPKSVEISHRSVCNLIYAENSILNVTADDIVYQGFSIAFDAAIEEIWPTFMTGATLFVATAQMVHAGADLAPILAHAGVTVVSCAPTLFSMLEEDIPTLRTINFVGEPCPPELVKRWHHAGRRILNTYGPTEATVTATAAVLQPGKLITIGRPLPNYSVYILNEQMQRVADGESGELHIGGIGLAKGYIGKPELTAKKFVHNPFFSAAKRDPMLYKTGDLARFTADGEIEFLGRIDTQVKIRGFRVELAEIETVLLAVEGVKAVAVNVYKDQQNIDWLVGYVVMREGKIFSAETLKAQAVKFLPPYMIPTLIEEMKSLPTLASGKVDRKQLPKPAIHHEALSKNFTPAKTEVEKKIVAVWEDLFKHTPISVKDDFFLDLGGHSLFAAKAVSMLRKDPTLQQMSMLDIYENPTIGQLAKKWSEVKEQPQAAINRPTSSTNENYSLGIFSQFLGCGLQFVLRSWEFLLIFLVMTYVANKYALFSLESIAATLFFLFAIPPLLFAVAILSKWLLLWRVKPGEYRLWGSYYLRWWLVQRMQHFAPVRYLVGSPLMNLYCRLMGAKIGKNCYIGTDHIASFDLITIGDQVSINYGAKLFGYIVEDGYLKIGSISIGNQCFIGSYTVLERNTRLQDNVLLEDQSMLPVGATLSKGGSYHGSPARFLANEAKIQIPRSSLQNDNSITKKLSCSLYHYVALCFIEIIYYLALLPGILLVCYYYDKSDLIGSVLVAAPVGAISFFILLCTSIVLSKKILLGKIVAGNYSLKSSFYIRRWMVELLMGSEPMAALCDSLYLPMLLRLLGAKLGKRVEMTDAAHATPDLLNIHDESYTTGGALLGVPRVYGDTMLLAPITIGRRTFVGNLSITPAGTELGAGCLLGSLSIPPYDSSAKTPNTFWFGSPSFQLPRREVIDGFSEQQTYYPRRSLYVVRALVELLRTLPVMLSLVALSLQFMTMDFLMAHYSVKAMLILFPIIDFSIAFGMTLVAIVLKWILVGRYRECVKPWWSIFVWKNDIVDALLTLYITPTMLEPLIGTPFMAFFLRLMGMKIGKRVFIDTKLFCEMDLTIIGDDVALNADSMLLTHLFEDRLLKLGRIQVTDGCTVGPGSVVQHSSLMESGSYLGSLSLLMKGETLPAYSRWEGVPAQTVRGTRTSPVAIPKGIPDVAPALNVVRIN